MPSTTLQQRQDFTERLQNFCGLCNELGINIVISNNFSKTFIGEAHRENVEGIANDAKDIADFMGDILQGLDDDEDKRDARIASNEGEKQ